MIKGFSLVICCYNSAARIGETLGFIFKLDLPPGVQFEVIIVNNNSSDQTADVAVAAERLSNSQKFSFKVINQPIPGLSFARMAGIDAANFDVIIFCDDDNHLAQDYLNVATAILNENPSIGILGGLALPKFSVQTGEWIKDFYTSMAIGPQSDKDGFVQWVYGAGMVIKKEVFSTFEHRNISLLLSDRNGKILTSGGDAEICSLALYVGFNIYYSSRLVLFHAIPSHRLQKGHYLKARFNTIYPSIYLLILNEVISNESVDWKTIYTQSTGHSIKNLVYFTPRMVLGKHRFYSFFMFYRTFQTLIWLMLYKSRFRETFYSIFANLKKV